MDRRTRLRCNIGRCLPLVRLLNWAESMRTGATRLFDGHRLSQVRVLVAGAGLAGLSAASALERLGALVTVVEARTRVGGRVVTIRQPFAEGQTAEGGADIIEPQQTPVLNLARSLGLTPTPVLRRGFGYYGPGRDGRPRVQSLARTFTEISARLRPILDAYRAASCRWDSEVAVRIAQRSVADWLNGLNEQRRNVALIHRVRSLRGLFLADPERLSLLALIDFLSAEPFSGDEPVFRIAGGNDQLAVRLARRLTRTPRMSAVLRRVSQRTDGVIATIETDGRLSEWQGDYVVCALPATTLRDVRFEPALPKRHQEALRSLKYGNATRMLLQFDRRFWRRRDRPRAFASDGAHGAVWEGNEEQRGAPGILSLLAGGGASDEIRDIRSHRGIPGVIEQLHWLGTPSRLLRSHEIRWEDDPWSRGGYACFDPSFDPRLRDVLAQPAGRVMFAGEHTSQQWQGYMSGALESGERAAVEVAAAARRI
jgi:monoamine oxidase